MGEAVWGVGGKGNSEDDAEEGESEDGEAGADSIEHERLLGVLGRVKRWRAG
jgi:hypothetical protein